MLSMAPSARLDPTAMAELELANRRCIELWIKNAKGNRQMITIKTSTTSKAAP